MPTYFPNEEVTYIKCDQVEENTFINKPVKKIKLPEYQEIKDKLPIPLWEGHESTIECYYKAWELAFSNIRNPEDGTGFVAPFIDAAFNGYIFMWDSCFMLMFGKWAHDIFNFQETLDNFYSHQHKDGFISREIHEGDGSEKFTHFDPVSTGPNIMPWCEWEYYLLTGDKERVKQIFPVLLGYHRWLKRYRTWRDGSYWNSGWGCGMDNQPRLQDNSTNEKRQYDHGHMVWVDTCFQQIISCNVLMDMANICGRQDEIEDIVEECEHLKQFVNDKLWDEKSAFYYDLWKDNTLSGVKSVGSYWALLADIVPESRLERFIAHLDNENEFKRPHRVPTLSADDAHYCPEGNYWCGSIWAPTNYMVLRGLERYGKHSMAFEIAKTSLDCVTEVFEKTGTIWENYAPEYMEKGSIAKPDFVGWSGLFPISILFEYVFGIQMRADTKEIIWNINLTEEFGVKQLPFGQHGSVSLLCKARKNTAEKPEIVVESDTDFTLVVVYEGNQEVIEVKAK